MRLPTNFAGPGEKHDRCGHSRVIKTARNCFVIKLGAAACGVDVVDAGAREMSLLKSVFRRGRAASESRYENLAESSVDALRRVEAECDWSDAAMLLAELAPELQQPQEPPAACG